MADIKMFNTLEDAYLYSSDEMSDISKYVLDNFDFFIEGYDGDIPYSSDTGEEAYATLLTWLSGKYDSDTRDILKDNFSDNSPYLLPSYENFDNVSAEDKNTINSIMHILHTEIPDIRSYALDRLSYFEEAGIENETAYPPYSGIVLTGKSLIPEEWKEKIQEEVSDLDVKLEIRMSWTYSHLDNGDNYSYNIPEAINVDIKGLSKEDVELARDRINNLEFVYQPEEETDNVESDDVDDTDNIDNIDNYDYDYEDDYDYDPID